MPKRKIEPCIPARATAVPIGDDWIHEIKHDGYRLIVQRDNDRVRLFTRNGHDWTDRYPWIVESARQIRQKRFVIDGEAVVLGVDGVSSFDELHSGKCNEQVQLYAFDMLALMATTCASCHYRCARPTCTTAGAPARRHLHRHVRTGRDRAGFVSQGLRVRT